jgi:hypothetical protein
MLKLPKATHTMNPSIAYAASLALNAFKKATTRAIDLVDEELEMLSEPMPVRGPAVESNNENSFSTDSTDIYTDPTYSHLPCNINHHDD